MASALDLTVMVEPGRAARAVAERGWAAVIDEFAASDAAMSRFRDDSSVTALDRASLRGEAMAVDRRLSVAVHASDRAHRLTGGRFDPRVVGLLDSWGYRGAALGEPIAGPTAADPRRIVERVDRERIRLPHPVDLGGIGKGLALRWATDRLTTIGIRRFVLDAGGDIVSRGTGVANTPWLIGIEDPAGGPGPLAVIRTVNGAIATSSIRRQRWMADGRPRHHLVDPATREPADGGLYAVTVAGPDPAWSEVWSKSLLIGGLRRIGPEARSRGMACWWVDEEGRLEMTPAARAQTVWVASEA
jgi:thiamine biosynthesis lipoprotein